MAGWLERRKEPKPMPESSENGVDVERNENKQTNAP